VRNDAYIEIYVCAHGKVDEERGEIDGEKR
jgi:hypothetical protein